MANGLKKQKQKWKALAKHKSSLVLYLITILAAAITVFVLGYLIVYILANGIPHLKPSLFAFTYTSDNVSMMPALINTVLMTLATLIVAVPLGIFAAIYLVEYAKKGKQAGEHNSCDGRDTDRNSINCLWLVWYVVFRRLLQMGIFPFVRSSHLSNYGASCYYANDRRGTYGSAGFLPGRKLWAWCRKTANCISRSFAECRSGDFIWCYFGYRTNCWRDRSIDLYGWNNCKSAKQHF